MKKFAWKKCWKMFLEALFFAFEKNFFRVSVQNFGHCRLHEIIGLQLSQCLSANHNPELRCVICTGVTLFAPVLHLNCTTLGQSESSNFFMCIITAVSKQSASAWNTWSLKSMHPTWFLSIKYTHVCITANRRWKSFHVNVKQKSAVNLNQALFNPTKDWPSKCWLFQPLQLTWKKNFVLHCPGRYNDLKHTRIS